MRKGREYPYAVFYRFEEPSYRNCLPESCHLTIDAAQRAAKKANERSSLHDPYYVSQWDGRRWDYLAPAPSHDIDPELNGSAVWADGGAL